MSPVVRHVGLPALAPAAIVALYFTPVQTFGCVVRGLMAAGVAVAAGIAAIVTTVFALRARVQRNEPGTWWRRIALVSLEAAGAYAIAATVLAVADANLPGGIALEVVAVAALAAGALVFVRLTSRG